MVGFWLGGGVWPRRRAADWSRPPASVGVRAPSVSTPALWVRESLAAGAVQPVRPRHRRRGWGLRPTRSRGRRSSSRAWRCGLVASRSYRGVRRRERGLPGDGARGADDQHDGIASARTRRANCRASAESATRSWRPEGRITSTCASGKTRTGTKDVEDWDWVWDRGGIGVEWSRSSRITRQRWNPNMLTPCDRQNAATERPELRQLAMIVRQRSTTRESCTARTGSPGE